MVFSVDSSLLLVHAYTYMSSDINDVATSHTISNSVYFSLTESIIDASSSDWVGVMGLLPRGIPVIVLLFGCLPGKCGRSKGFWVATALAK